MRVNFRRKSGKTEQGNVAFCRKIYKCIKKNFTKLGKVGQYL